MGGWMDRWMDGPQCTHHLLRSSSISSTTQPPCLAPLDIQHLAHNGSLSPEHFFIILEAFCKEHLEKHF
jgi:hypothetical protein